MADTVMSELASTLQTELAYKAYTVDDVLIEALGMMGESVNDKADFEDGLMPQMNELIAEVWKANNAVREANGKKPFTEYPVVKDKKDIVPLEYDTIRNAVVYGLAYWLLLIDDEYIKANAMLAQYNKFLGKGRAAYKTVESVM